MNKDILEEAKLLYGEHPRVWKLIQEIEKLRELVYPYMGEWQKKIDSLTKENIQIKEQLIDGAVSEAKLEVENKELKEGIDRVSKQANGMIIVDDSEEISTLKAQLAESQERVWELTQAWNMSSDWYCLKCNSILDGYTIEDDETHRDCGGKCI